MVLINDPISSFILSGAISFSSPCSYQSNSFPVSGRLSPHSLEMLSISPQQACASRLWFSNNSVRFFFARMLSELICGRSWHFLLHSFISMIYLLLFISSGGIVMLLSSLIFSVCEDRVFFRAYPFNRSVVFSFEYSHLIKFCLPSQQECGL